MNRNGEDILLSLFRRESLTDSLRTKAVAVREQMERLDSQGLVLADDIAGKRILDWECGSTVHSAYFVHCGAKLVVSTDSYPMWPDPGRTFSASGDSFMYRGGKLSDVLGELPRDIRFNLCFSNTASEHIVIDDLRQSLGLIHERLSPDGVLFVNHDNYFSPMGAHDNALRHSPDDYRRIVPSGPACWERGECDESSAIRDYLHTHIPHPSDKNSPPVSLVIQKGDYGDCTRCPYFKRTRLWAHLLYEEEFLALRGTWHRDCLNKLRLDELVTILDECGFAVERRHALVLADAPPPELLATFSREELTSTTVKFRCIPR